MADLSFLDPNMNSTDETPMGAVSPDLSFLDPDQGVKPADPSALINARELTHGMDPQRTAKVINLSRKAGLPPRIVEERMDEIERREMLNDGLLADVASKAPKTTSFLSDPDRFAVAQTDIENLAELERLIATGPVDSFAMSGQMPVNGDNKLAKELIADPIGAIGKGLIKAPGSLAEMGLNLFSILPGAIDSAAQGVEQLTGLPRGGYFGELRDAALGASKWIRENYLNAEPLQISEDLRGKGAWDNPEIMLDPEWVAYVTTDILPSIGATIAAYMASGPAAAGVVGGGMEAGGLYQELLDEGMEDWKANTASQVFGILSGALNAIGADKVLGQGVATSWAKRLVKGFFVKGAVEGATEWAEEPIQALVAGIARGDSVPTIAADIVEATQKGFDVFLPSLITGGLAGTATERMEYQKAQFAAKEQEVLDMLTENVAQSNLAQLDPVLYQEALTVLKEGGKISDIHIPASAIMSDNLAEVSEILNQFGVSFEAFDLALNTGGTVAIPIEQYGAAIAANPDLAARFVNDRKLSADGYTRNELAKFNQEWAQEAKRVLQLAAETEELKDQEDAETKAIFEQVYAARQAAGRVPDAARLDAAQFTAALVSMAKMSEGKYTPTQLFEAYMPQIRAGQPAVDEQTLQQDAAYAGVENRAEIEEAARLWAEMGTESPYFKKWFGDSKVVDAEGKPLVVYHGTGRPGFTQFMRGQGGYVYFTPDQDYANRFAGNTGGVYPSYLSMKKPLDLTHFGDGGVDGLRLRDYLRDKLGIDLSGIEFKPSSVPVYNHVKHDALKWRLEDHGYDGLVIKESGSTAYLAFQPEQIKSVFNRGTFDANDPRILMQSVETAGATTTAEAEEAARLWAEMGTESPYFKKWADGRQVFEVYHGTDAEFDAFDTSDRSMDLSARNPLGDNIGSFFASKERDAKRFGPKVGKYYVGLKNPMVFKTQEDFRAFMREHSGMTPDVRNAEGFIISEGRFENNTRKAIESAGHDGVVILNPQYSAKKDKPWVVAFDPTQIKSVNNRGTFDPADARVMYQVSPEVARTLNYESKIPTDPLFADAVANTPGAELVADGLELDLTRYQKEEQTGGTAIRTGVFYLPTGSAQEKYYRGGKYGYGGTVKVQGRTLLKAPLFVKGATGGKAPEAAYDSIMGKKAYSKMREEVLQVVSGWGLTEQAKVANIRALLDKYGATEVDAYEIFTNSRQGNTLAYAIQENIVAHAVREAGYDSVVGYSKKKDGRAFISEVFDVREMTYPDESGYTVINDRFYQSLSVNNRGTVDANDPRILMQQPAETAGATTAPEVAEAQRLWAEMGTESPYFKKWFGDSKVVDEQGKPLVVYHGTGADIEAFDPDRTGKGNDQLGSGFYFTSDEDTAKGYAGEKGNLTPSYLSIQKPIVLGAEQGSLSGVRLTAKQAEAIMLLAPNIFDAEKSPLVDWVDNGGKKFTKAHVARVATNYVDQLGSLENDFFRDNATAFREAVNKVTGYDGVSKVFPSGERHFVAWFPEQIKSVNNRGTFDANDPRILYQTAFHGSPYRFDKFTLDAIGTGEGAQAYGWGLYFAGKKEVAEWYRKTLGMSKYLRENQFNADGTPNRVNQVASQIDAGVAHDRILAGLDALGHSKDEALSILREAKKLFNDLSKSGQLYEVDIPEDDVMLHWDKPLSEQPEKVREALLSEVERHLPSIAHRYAERGVSSEDIRKILEVTRRNVVDPNTKGEEFYANLTEQHGSDKAASEYLNSLGIKGIKYLDGTSRGAGEGSYNYVIFDDDAIEILNTFYQDQSEPQASFTFKTKSGRPLIELFRTANQSSFLHETGHLYLEMLRELALAPNAPAPIAALWAQAKTALKIDDGPIPREAHEEWARNLEAYFLEGAAPSLGLRKIFAQYAQWLRSIYKQVEQIFLQSGTQFNEDLKPIFDRIFATEKDIEEARSFYSSQKPFFAAVDPKVMAKEREKYEERRMRARESMEDKRLRQLTDAWVKANGGKGKIRAEVAEEVKARPVMAVIKAAAAGINMKALDASVGEDLRKKLKAVGRYSSLVKKDGTVDPDILAAEHGYDSAVAMVEDMLAFPGEKAAITAGVEARMEAERQRIARGLAETDLAADEAYHNDDQLAVLVAEFEILSRQAAQKVKRLEAAMVRDVAKQLLASEKVGFATQTGRFARLERRAAKLARSAYERGDAKKAAEYKRQEVLNHAMFIESVKLKEGVAKTAARIKRGIQKTKGISPEVKTLLQGLGIQYGILPYKGERDPVRAFEMWNQDLVAKGGKIPTIEGWVDEMRKLGISAPLDPFLNNAAAVSYKDITVGQFRALEEGVRILRRVDRGLHTVTWIDGSTITMEDAIERLQAHVAGRGGKAPDPLTYDPNAVTLAARNFFAEHTKTSTIIQALDNWEAGGLFYQLIYRPIMDADSDLSARWATEAPKIKALFEPIRRQLRKKVVVLGKARPRAQLVAVALNIGNQGNRERLMAGLGINEAQLQQLLDPLTTEEMDFVQAVWDYIDTFREEAFAVERRLTGREPKRVDPVPFTFKGKTYAGGYYPVVYDKLLRDQKGEARDAKEALDALFGGTPAGTAMTAHGHLEARASAGTGERLSQELSVISDHVTQVLRDITHREAVINVAKLLKNKQIMALITDVVGREKAKQLWPWLVSVSKEGREQIQLTAVEKMLLHFRPAMTFYTMAYKVGTALIQAAGFFQVFEFVRAKHVGQAVWQLYGKGLLSLNMFSDGEIISHPLIKEIREKSPQMNERLLNADRDIRDATKEFSTSESWLATYKKAGFKATVAVQFYVADVVAWQGAYLQALTDGMTEKDAINQADFVVEQAMGAGYTRALSKIQRGGSIQRFLTMFYTFGNVLYNLAARRAGITKKQLASGQYGAAALGASSFLVLQWVMPVLFESLVRGDVADDDDDETLAEKLLVNLLTYPAQSVLIARELSGIAKGFKYRFSPALKPFESVGQWISSVARAIEQEDASIAVKPTAQLVGTTTGLIPAQFINSGEVLTDYLTGEDQELSVKELLYGKRRQ
jgi:hypothetical protein